MIEFRLSSAELPGRERCSACNSFPYLGITNICNMNIQAEVFWLSVEFVQREPNSAARIDPVEDRPHGIADENVDRSNVQGSQSNFYSVLEMYGLAQLSHPDRIVQPWASEPHQIDQALKKSESKRSSDRQSMYVPMQAPQL